MYQVSKNLILPIAGVALLSLLFFINIPSREEKSFFTKVLEDKEPSILVEGVPWDTFFEPPGRSVADENLLKDAVNSSQGGSGGEKSKEVLEEKVEALSDADPAQLKRKSLTITRPFAESLLPDLPGILDPVSMKGVYELLELLKGFGELISSPEGILSREFAELDAKIIAKTKEVYRNPHQTLSTGEAFILGEQCGLSGGAFSFPPGRNDLTTACGGTPPIGGTEGAPNTGTSGTCNTDPPCYFSGFCFQECYSYLDGGYCYCWVPSCYGVCGKGSYLWDSVTGTCGCAD